MRPAHLLSRMRTRLLLASALFSACTASLHAQVAARADRLTGAWSGYIGRSEATASPVKVLLTLKPDGTLSGTITGPEITPGDITTSTFDAATGVLAFSVVIRERDGTAGGSVKFEGRVANDTVSGKMMLGNETGVFRWVKDPPAVRGQMQPLRGTVDPSAAARPSGDAGLFVRRGFIQVNDWITRAAQLVPAERYSYRPVGTVRTFGQLVAHVIDGARYYCARGAGRDIQWTDSTEKTVTTKAALVEALAKSIADCTPAYDAPSNIGPLMENFAHSNLHYGNMVTYMRMLGLVPPSS